MDSELKKKLKNAPFVIDLDKGEKYYQIHMFEGADSSDCIQISTKINKDGKIEMYTRGSKMGQPFTATTKKPATKKEFQSCMDSMKSQLEKTGFVHNFIDLSQCEDDVETMQLLSKSDSRFKFEIKHKPDV